MYLSHLIDVSLNDRTSLKCKLADYIEKHGNDHSFFPPRGYQRGHLYDLYIKDPPFVCDKYCYSSSVLAECKKLLSAQFWNECNKILDKIQPALTSDLRAQAMGEAVVFFRENPVYAERPDDGNVLKGTSTLYTVPLTATLCAAPRLPPKEEDNSEEEIVAYPPNIRPRMSPNGPYCDWSLSYLERIFTKLIKVKEDVERFEGDKEVWKKLRWVVYDKVCSRIFALSLASHIRAVFKLARSWPALRSRYRDLVRPWRRMAEGQDVTRGDAQEYPPRTMQGRRSVQQVPS